MINPLNLSFLGCKMESITVVSRVWVSRLMIMSTQGAAQWSHWCGRLLFSCSVVSDSLQPHGLQHPSLLCPSPSPGVCSNSCPLSRWYFPIILSSVIPFSSCLQYFPASRSFPMSRLSASGGQSIRASASALVLPMNIWGLFSLGLTGLISLLYKELLRVFSTTIVQKPQFGGSQPSLWSNSHICTWVLEKP